MTVLVTLLVCPAYAQDVNTEKRASGPVAQQVDPIGLWEWEQGFGGRTRPRQIELQVKEGKLVGSAQSPSRGAGNAGGPPGMNDPVPLTNLELKGDKISFDVTRKFGANEFTEKFSGVISGASIASRRSAMRRSSSTTRICMPRC